jgi:hypothetical protein
MAKLSIRLSTLAWLMGIRIAVDVAWIVFGWSPRASEYLASDAISFPILFALAWLNSEPAGLSSLANKTQEPS